MAIRDFFKKAGEFFQPEASKVRARDVARGLPGAFKDVGREIAQGTLRGLDSLGRLVVGQGPTRKKTPTGKLETTLFGEKAFSAATEGADVTRLLGIREDSRAGKIINPVVGLGFTLIDAVPGARGARKGAVDAAESVIKVFRTVDKPAVQTISKLTDANAIKQVLRQEVGFTDQAFKSIKTDQNRFLNTLTRAADEDTVTKLLKTEQDKYIKHLEGKVSLYKKMTDDQFAKRTAALTKQKEQIAKLPINRRIVQGIRPTETAQINPYTALKQRVADMNKSARAGAKVAKKEVFDLQSELVEQIKTQIPVSVRGKFVTQIRNANTPKKLERALEKVDSEATAIAQLAAKSREAGKTKSKIAFINKMGEFNQVAVRDIKAKLGIKKPISKMTGDELDKYYDELYQRFLTKQERGSEFAKRKNQLDPDEYATAHQFVDKPTVAKSIKGGIKDIRNTADKYVGVLSERLREIDPKILGRVRKFEFDIKNNTMRNIEGVTPYVKTMSKIRKADPQMYHAIDLALKNGDIDGALKLAGDNKELGGALKDARKVLDDIHSRAKDVKSDVGYLEGYFPRNIAAKKADEFMDFISNTPLAGPINRAVAEREMALGLPPGGLPKENRVAIINSMVRGYRNQAVSLASPKSLEERVFGVLTPELNRFYEETSETLPKYIRSMNEHIEARKMFGKVEPNLLKEDYDLDSSIGAFTEKLVDQNKLTGEQARELSNIFKARFNQGQMSSFVGDLKNAGYLLTMGQPTNALTQIGDLGLAAYNNGTLNTTKNAIKSLFGKTKVTAQDLGIDQISREFMDKGGKFNVGKLVNDVFRLTGLSKMDFIGKNTLIEGAFEGAQKKALQGDEKLLKTVTDLFGGRADEVVEKLAKGTVDEDTKFYLFNTLSDFQPITDLEVPEKYLTSENGKLFYMLQTWTLKTLNTYRREVVKEISGATSKTQAANGVKNFVKLTAALTLAGATANEIKDFVRGKDVPFKDNVINSMLQLSGVVNRYSLGKGMREGTLVQEAVPLPPQFSLIDNTLNDAIRAGKQFTDTDKSFDVNDVRSIRNIPLGGDLYYWWFGHGTGSPVKAGAKEPTRRKATTRSSGSTRRSATTRREQ